MDNNDVELFLSVAKSRNITHAATVHHISQSTASYRIKLLEKELGCQLFFRDRGKQGAQLTIYGEQFISIAQQWLTIYRDTQSLKFLPSNALTIATIDSVNSSLLPPIYQSVSQGDSKLRLRIMTHQSKEVYELIDNKTADIGFVSVPYPMKNVITLLTYTQKYFVVRYSQHPTIPSTIEPSALDPRYEIYQDWGGDYNLWHEQIWGPLNKYHMWVDTVTILPHILTDERYWTIMPSTCIQTLLAASRTIRVDELKLPEPYSRICYVIRHRFPKASSREGLKVFEKELRLHMEHMQQYPMS